MPYFLQYTHRKLVLLILLCGSSFSIGACVSDIKSGDTVRKNHYFAEPYLVTEKVKHVSTDWFDDTLYQREYVIQSEGQDVATFYGTETYWSPETKLTVRSPKKEGEWLAVFSMDQVWIWKPGQSMISFVPIESLESNVWKDNQMKKPKNWSLTWATDFQIINDKWILEYTDISGIDETEVSSSFQRNYYFVSEDQGKTFVPKPGWKAK